LGDPISVTHKEFDEALLRLEQGKVELKTDRDQAWKDFSGWWVNYDIQIQGIVRLIMASDAPWTGDRHLPTSEPRIF
jgi:hypothetical protein